MLAKLSGSPISTQISSVTAPATSSGTIVSSTSVTRRSASHSSRLITSSAQMPAWMNAFTMVSPDLRIETGPPIAFGSAASTASANLRSVLVVVGIALRQRLDANQAVLGLPAVHQFRRQRLQA